jgi:hypothetical protein
VVPPEAVGLALGVRLPLPKFTDVVDAQVIVCGSFEIVTEVLVIQADSEYTPEDEPPRVRPET